MTSKQAFAVGYLARLAHWGFTPSSLTKQAAVGEGVAAPALALADVLGGTAARGLEAAGGLISKLGPYAVLLGTGVPLLGGTMTGWMHSGLADVSPEDLERRKEQDYIDAYRSEAQRIKAKLKREMALRRQLV